MSTIFDGYRKLNDKQIINQLAILETINLSNIFTYYKNTFKETTVETIKKLLGTSEKDNLDEKTNKTQQEKVNELYELLVENRKELRKLSREELDIKFKLCLCDRANCNIEDSEEEISLAIVNEAVKRLSLSEYLTPSQKIDNIYKFYNDKVLNYLKEDPTIADQNKKFDFSDPKLLIHIFTETIKSWDMIQGSKRIDREVLLESVWLAAMSNVEPFTPKIEDLPSFNMKSKTEDPCEVDIEFFDSIRVYRSSIKKLEVNDYKLSDLDKEMSRYEKASVNKKAQLLEFNNQQKEIEKKLREIDVDLEYTVNIYNQEQRRVKRNCLLENQTNVEESYKIVKEKIEELSYEVKALDIVLRDMSLDKEYLQEEEKELKDFRNDARKVYLIQQDKRYSEIKNLWIPFYNKFNIESQFIKEAVEYNIDERLEIERVLAELHSMKDPRVLSSNFKEEQINNNYNIEFLLDEERIICIDYVVEKDEDKFSVKLVRILECTE